MEMIIIIKNNSYDNENDNCNNYCNDYNKNKL